MVKGGTNPRYLRSGHVAYVHHRAIWIASFDLRSRANRRGLGLLRRDRPARDSAGHGSRRELEEVSSRHIAGSLDPDPEFNKFHLCALATAPTETYRTRCHALN